MGFFFSGQSSDDFPWLKINKITSSILPPMEQKLIQIPGRPGAYHAGKERGVRKETIVITILGDSQEDLAAKKRILADWLDTDTPQTFYYSYEPNKEYQAILDGETDMDKVVTDGQITLNFLIPDPYATGVEKVVSLDTKGDGTPYQEGEPIPVTNAGSVPVFPTMRFEFTQPTTEFAIITEDRYMYFGQPAPVDTVTPAPERVRILLDDGSSLANYSSGISVDGGVIAGSFSSNGDIIRPADYGEGTAWHGPAAIRSLGQQLQDFTLQAEVAFKAGYPYQVGRLEIYLLDINNAIIGKIAIRDSTARVDNPYMEARAGASRQFVNYTGKPGRWSNFGGPIRITRKGKRWEFSASKRAANGKLYDTFSYSFYDKDSQYQQKLAGFQIHIGKYGTLSHISTVYIDRIEVWNENTYNPVTQVPYAFDTGDVLEINCATGEVLKNNEPFFPNPESEYIKIDPGSHSLVVSPQGIFQNSTLSFRERWR
ncbi:distal tail protein Dit [Thermoactinomyces sp. CICC 23799]|jgi:predicted phage tail component-like protein|uniref:distal tail protein Dit n=1 Tax=Thermoactinomyces sp. CICC 23799 TaxID=2767429 RepID=UPI0018DB8D67|nr:distal tail protein Dit [Thermoactinomyces sp. CICC 23799]MBH8601191.1 phage tail family protein [Thermoactinomyces sp. CICC 23799]